MWRHGQAPPQLPLRQGRLIPEKLAIVGSRWGYDSGQLAAFVQELFREAPDTIVISGGAKGADEQAEGMWRMLGGEVWSLRPREDEETKHWGVEGHVYKPGALGAVTELTWTEIFKDFRSAAAFRNWMIVEECDRLVAFLRPGGSAGANFTLALAHDIGRPTDSFEREL